MRPESRRRKCRRTGPPREPGTALPGCGSLWCSPSLDWVGHVITATVENHLRGDGKKEEREETRERRRLHSVRQERAEQGAQGAAGHQRRQDGTENVAVPRVAQRPDDAGRKDHEERNPLRDVLRVALSEDQDRYEDRPSSDAEQPAQDSHDAA